MADILVHTCGNATLIATEDGKPLLATDPWLHTHRAYFGSWATSHKIPDMHLDLIKKSKFIWISHFHPDHLSLGSLNEIRAREKTILMCEQYQNRPANDLRAAGFSVIEVPAHKYIRLSSNIEIATFCSALTMDSALIIRSNNCAVVNLNDTTPDAGISLVKQATSTCKDSILLKLACYGDVDMINLYDHEGRFIQPLAAEKPAPGLLLTKQAHKIHCKKAMHFSSFHQYARTDSEWANQFVTPEEDLTRGWLKSIGHIRHFSTIALRPEGIVAATEWRPEANSVEILKPERFQDDWSESLSKTDCTQVQSYLNNLETILPRKLIRLKIKSGNSLVSSTRTDGEKTGKIKSFTLHAPRHSLMRAVRENIIDDLLIGNFAKLYFDSEYRGSYRTVLSWSSKIKDNSQVQNASQVKSLLEYQRKSYDSRSHYAYSRFKERAREEVTSRLDGKTKLLSALKNIYQNF